MKNLKTVLLIIISSIFCLTSVTAANRYWIATSTAYWNSTANWSTTSGGFGGASVPGSADIAIFNNLKVGSCRIDANVNVAGISIVSGYTGDISQNTYTITVGTSNYSQAAGTFSGGSARISTKLFTLSGGTFTSTTDTLKIGTIVGNATIFTHSAGTFNHNNGAVTFEVNSSTSTYTVDVITATLFNKVYANYPSGPTSNSILQTGTNDTVKVLNNFMHGFSSLKGNWRIEGNIFVNKGNAGSGNLILFGAANQTYTLINFVGRTCNLVINKSGGTVSAAGGSPNFAVQTFKMQAGTFIAPTGTLFIGGSLAANTTIFDHTAGTFNPNNGLVKFDANNSGFTSTIKPLSTTPFYNVYINCVGTLNLQNSTDTLRTNNDLTLQAGTFNTGTISVKRHITVINTIGGTGKVAFTGTEDQEFTLTNATDKFNITNLIIKQSPGKKVTLKSAAIFDQSGQAVTFTSGTIISTSTNLLTIGHGVTISGASDNSFVDGPVKKIGNAAFTFPLGENGQYRSIAISAPTNTTDAYTGEYFNVNSNSLYAHTSKDASLAQLSTSEYWKLDRNVGTANVNVTLSWENTTSCSFTSLANLRVAAWNGTTWKDKGNNGTTGTTSAGTIVTNASTTYGPYTLATTATFDCTCALATIFGNSNSCLNSQSLASGEIWFKFLADSKTKQIRLSNKGVVTTANIDKMQIYNSCGGSIIGGDTMKTTADTVLTVDLRNLTVGNYYYVRLIKSATGTGNADYDICLKNGPEKSLAEHTDSPWIGCGLDFVQSSLRLNQRMQGGTAQGGTSPTAFNIAGIPIPATILNAYIWITTVDNFNFAPPGTQKVFDFSLDGSNLTANLLGISTFTGGTCWPNTATTNTFTLDVTAALVGTNVAHNFTFNIANATRYVGLGTTACDVTGATLLIVYKEPCTAGVNEGKLVLWQGLDVVQAGNAAYTLTDLDAYADNASEEVFIVVSDVETAAATAYDINGSASQFLPANMHSYVNQVTTFTPGQVEVNFNITGNGADCYAVSVIGAYSRDGSHECYCVGPPLPAFNTNFCEEFASTMIGLNGGSSTILNITNNIVINGTFTIDQDITFENCPHIIMGPDAKIVVKTGKTLNIKTSVFSPCDYFWDGIYVSEPNSQVIAANSQFNSARNAIVSENGCNYSISACTFYKCYIGMIVRNYNPTPIFGQTTPPHPGSVTASSFQCVGNLIPPYDNQRSFVGIDVNNAFGVTIGAGASNANTFDNMHFGIRAFNSQVFAYHNTFTNIYNTVLNPTNFLTLAPPLEGAIHGTKSNPNQFILSAGTGLTVGTIGTNNGNVFTGCNIGVYSNRLLTNIEYNDFNNVLKGAWVQNLMPNTTVSHNSFDNTAGYQGKGTAIQVENIIGGGSARRLTIRDNSPITDFVTGIWARNIASLPYAFNYKPFWIYNNDIVFNLTNNTLNRYGIRVEKCNYAIVAQNSVVKNSTVSAGEYTRLRGISIASSQKAMVYDNYPITKMGQGIYTTGNDNASLFYCNQFTSNYNGFFFGPGTSITQQGSTAWNTHNQWITNLLPYDMASSQTYIVSSPINWYYSTTVTPNTSYYNPNPIDAPASLKIIPVGNAHTTNKCGSTSQPPDAIVDTPDDAAREIDYGKIMRNEKSYDAYEETYKQYDNEYAYLVFKNDSGWLDLGADDADYQNWYDSIETSNIGKLLALRELADTLLNETSNMHAQPIDTAILLIDDITPNKTIETNELAVWDIYFRTFAIDYFELTKADSATLFNIAYQMGSEGGIGVYMARIMLNLDVDLGESNKTDDVFLTDQPGDESRSFILYPNPAKDEVNILFKGYEEGEKISIEVFDIAGRKSIDRLVYLSGNIVTINTSTLEKGIYLYRIVTGLGDRGNGKLVIVK